MVDCEGKDLRVGDLVEVVQSVEDWLPIGTRGTIIGWEGGDVTRTLAMVRFDFETGLEMSEQEIRRVDSL